MNSRMASFDCADLYREHAFLSLAPEVTRVRGLERSMQSLLSFRRLPAQSPGIAISRTSRCDREWWRREFIDAGWRRMQCIVPSSARARVTPFRPGWAGASMCFRRENDGAPEPSPALAAAIPGRRERTEA